MYSSLVVEYLVVILDYTLKGELYPGTMDSTRHLDQMMSNGVSGVESSTVQHHKNGYYREPDRNDSTATDEESDMSSCRLQETHPMIANSLVDTRNTSCGEDAIDRNRLGFAENQLPVKSCGNYSAVPMTTQPGCITRDYWMECYVPTPVPKCRALSGHYL